MLLWCARLRRLLRTESDEGGSRAMVFAANNNALMAEEECGVVGGGGGIATGRAVAAAVATAAALGSSSRWMFPFLLLVALILVSDLHSCNPSIRPFLPSITINFVNNELSFDKSYTIRDSQLIFNLVSNRKLNVG